MLKVGNGELEVRGTKLDILSELSTLMMYLVRKEIVGREQLDDCVRLATLSHEELENEVEELWRGFMKNLQKQDDEVIMDLLKAMFPDKI